MSDLAEADPSGSPAAHVARLMRHRSGSQSVTNIELLFDLVYVFAVTQLSGLVSTNAMATACGKGSAVGRVVRGRGPGRA